MNISNALKVVLATFILISSLSISEGQLMNNYQKINIENLKRTGDNEYTLKDGTLIKERYSPSRETAVIQQIPANSPYHYQYQYYSNGVIELVAKTFYDIDVEMTFFNRQGEITKIENMKEIYNAKHTLAIDELVNIMKQRYNIDLLNKSTINGRPSIFSVRISASGVKVPFYSITLPSKNLSANMREIKINGHNGKTISDKDVFLRR